MRTSKSLESVHININTKDLRDLYENTNNQTQIFSFEGEKVIAKIVDVYDGDTFKAVFKFNGKYQKFTCRCLGYDSPEMKPIQTGTNRTNEDIKEEKEFALRAKNQFIDFLRPRDRFVLLHLGKFDKYGRILTSVYVYAPTAPFSPFYELDNGYICVNELMIKSGLVLPYDGKTKKTWHIENMMTIELPLIDFPSPLDFSNFVEVPFISKCKCKCLPFF